MNAIATPVMNLNTMNAVALSTNMIPKEVIVTPPVPIRRVLFLFILFIRSLAIPTNPRVPMNWTLDAHMAILLSIPKSSLMYDMSVVVQFNE